MSLIADALKRAQEQRRTGPGDDRARRMLSGSGPLRVETRDRATMTRPLALAVAALVVAAVVFAGAILMTPTSAPAARQELAVGTADADGASLPGGSLPDGAERGAEPVSDGGEVSEAAFAGGLLSEERFDGGLARAGGGGGARGAAEPGRSAAGDPGPASAGGAERGADQAVEERGDRRDGRGVANARGGESSRPGGERVEPGAEGSSFRIAVRGGARERTAEQLFAAALGAHRSGDLEGAASLYRSAIEARPGDAELWNNLGAVYRKLSRTEEALAAFGSAVEAEPSYAPAWSNLGLLLEGLGRNGEAIEAFREALRQDPANLGARVNLANTYHSLGMRDEARGLLREVLDADPSFAEAHYGLARVLEEGGASAEAARHYRLFLELGSGRFPALEERVRERLVELTGGGS